MLLAQYRRQSIKLSWNNRTQLYFSAFSNKDAVLAPPLDSTNLVITDTNLPAISGDRPSLWNASATSAMRPMPPGRELSRLESSELSVKAGGAFNRPFIPGTAADTLLEFSPLRRLLANANRAPAPPRACVRVTESPLVNCPTSSELEFFEGCAGEPCALSCTLQGQRRCTAKSQPTWSPID